MAYHLIFIIGLSLEAVLEIISKLLNLKNLKYKIDNPEKEFENIFNKEHLIKTYNYLKTNTLFSIIKSILSISIVFIFIYSYSYTALSLYCKSLSSSIILSNLIMLGILMLSIHIISLPFSIINEFIIEKKFDFSTITVKTFILDNVKVILLTFIIGGLLLSLIFYIILKYKSIYWILAWIVISLFSLLMMKIFPTFIAPLFNKFEPVKDEELREKIFKIAQKAKFALKNILKNDASKRSKHSNAYFTGFGKNKQIVLFDNLLEQLTHDEIASVLGHEIGHFKKRHIWLLYLIQNLTTGLTLFLIYKLTFFKNFLTAFQINQLDYISIFIFTMFFTNSFLWIINFPLMYITRIFEFAADKFCFYLTGEHKHLINALIKLTKENLSNPYPHKMYSVLYYSHPPLIERIKSLKNFKKR